MVDADAHFGRLLQCQLVALLFAALPFKSVQVLAGVSVFRLVYIGVVVTSLCLLAAPRSGLAIPKGNMVAICCFLIEMLISSLLGFRSDDLSQVTELSIGVLLYCIILVDATNCDRGQLARIVIRAFLASLAVVACDIVLLALRGVASPRPLGLDPNYAGYLLVGAIALTGSVQPKAKRIALRVFYAATCILTASRGAVLLLIIDVCLEMAFGRPSREKDLRRALKSVMRLAILTLFVVIALRVPLIIEVLLKARTSSIRELAAKTLVLIENNFNDVRLGLWRQGLDEFLDHPLVGGGIGSLGLVYQRGTVVQQGALVAHNVYVQVLAEGGALGIAFFSWVCARSARAMSMFGSALQRSMSLFFLATLLNAGITGSLYDAGLWMTLALVSVVQGHQRLPRKSVELPRSV